MVSDLRVFVVVENKQKQVIIPSWKIKYFPYLSFQKSLFFVFKNHLKF